MRRTDRGSATVEFVGLSVLLLVPLVYVLVSVFAVQRAAFAVTAAAREAGRAYATAPSTAAAMRRARYAARLALADQGVRQDPELLFAAPGGACTADTSVAALRPGGRFVVCVRTVAPLPLTGGLGHRSGIAVNGRFTVVVDAYRAARP